MAQFFIRLCFVVLCIVQQYSNSLVNTQIYPYSSTVTMKLNLNSESTQHNMYVHSDLLLYYNLCHGKKNRYKQYGKYLCNQSESKESCSFPPHKSKWTLLIPPTISNSNLIHWTQSQAFEFRMQQAAAFLVHRCTPPYRTKLFITLCCAVLWQRWRLCVP